MYNDNLLAAGADEIEWADVNQGLLKLFYQIFLGHMFYPLDSCNTKKLKNKKTKCRFLINNNRILVKLFRKKPK